jgi:glycosyltransferase involved in cell wall biosynthesis
MKISVVVPSKGCIYLRYLFSGLREQSIKPYEVIVIAKECNMKYLDDLCTKYSIPCIIIEQKEGYVTRALNMGKREAKGDVVVIVDDDAIPLRKWLVKYAKLHLIYPNVAEISSRDVYLSFTTMRLMPTPDDMLTTRLYRWFVRPWLERPHPLLTNYRFGVYITKSLKVACGPYIPNKPCYSLPFRGVNMSFKKEALDEIEFPEHPFLKRAPGWEQYVGLQLIIRGYKSIYDPSNPILHIVHESLSRTVDKRIKKEIKTEFRIMKSLYLKLINDYAKRFY